MDEQRVREIVREELDARDRRASSDLIDTIERACIEGQINDDAGIAYVRRSLKFSGTDCNA
jgi:hypothetical protein